MLQKNQRKTLATIALLCMGLLGLLTGCGSTGNTANVVTATPTSTSSIPVLPITAINYGYIMPGTINIRSGLLDIAMVNNGNEAHQAQVARLNDGVTPAKVLDELVTKKNQAAAFSLLTFVGGPDTVSPGYGQEAILNLSAGQYVLLCFVVGSDGVAHVNKGMIHFFTVSSEQSLAAAPQSDGSIVMKDFSFTIPDIITRSRPLTLQVVNQGQQPHEMNIVKLAPGKGVQDIAAFFQSPSGPPPFEELGGMATMRAGESGWLSLDLEPGNYAVFSFIPNAKTSKSQLSLGMITAFTVK